MPNPIVKPTQLIKVNVELINRRCNLNQIYHMGWECATVHRVKAGEYKQNMVWVFCKDYLNDVVYAQINQTPILIHGLRYDPATDPPVDMDRLRVVVRNRTDSKFSENCWNAVLLLRSFEKRMRFKPTKIRETNLGDTFVLESDPRWMHATPLLSLWGCLARMGCYYDGKKDAWEWLLKAVKSSQSPDARYLSNAVKTGALKYLIENTTKCFDVEMKNNFSASDAGEVHGYGIQWWSNVINGLQTISATSKTEEEKEKARRVVIGNYPRYCHNWFWGIQPEASVSAVQTA